MEHRALKSSSALVRRLGITFALLSLVCGPTWAASTVVLVGDSTVATYDRALTLRGWGQILQDWARSGVVVQNEAVSGASSKSFRDEGHWARALGKKPDYVFIQFGHNDIGPSPTHHTDPDTTYRQLLRQYVDETRALGAVPVLVTPPVRRVYKDGTLVHEKLRPYVEAMIAVGAEMQVPVIPLYDDSFTYYADLTAEEAQKKVAPREDDLVHFNEEGASLLASVVLRHLSHVESRAASLFAPPALTQPIEAK